MPGKISKALGIKTGDVAFSTQTQEPFYRYGRVNRPVFYRDGVPFVEIIYPRAETNTFPLTYIRTVKYEGRWDKIGECNRGKKFIYEWIPFPSLRKMRNHLTRYQRYLDSRK